MHIIYLRVMSSTRFTSRQLLHSPTRASTEWKAAVQMWWGLSYCRRKHYRRSSVPNTWVVPYSKLHKYVMGWKIILFEIWFILQMSKNLQKGLSYKLLGGERGLFLNWFLLLCVLPRSDLFLFECNSTWRFPSCEENLWRGRCSSLFLWGKLFHQWIWPKSMLLFRMASGPSSVWRYLIFIALPCQILRERLAPFFMKCFMNTKWKYAFCTSSQPK